MIELVSAATIFANLAPRFLQILFLFNQDFGIWRTSLVPESSNYGSMLSPPATVDPHTVLDFWRLLLAFSEDVIAVKVADKFKA
jgi:hypothetical protein